MTVAAPAGLTPTNLLSLDQVHGILAATEPLSTVEFGVGDQVRFTVAPGWQHGIDAKAGTDAVDATIALGSALGATEFQLTKDAILEAAATVGLRKAHAALCPADLLEPHLNYWFRQGLADRRGRRDFQLLVAAGLGAAVTRASITPFSNLRLLEQAVAGIHQLYGTDATTIQADYKLTHSLRRTHVRLIVPGATRVITGTGVDDDAWSVGLQFRNSLIGDEKTSIDGYLFRWVCTNGAISTAAASGVWTRRRGGTEEDVYEWARGAVDAVLGGLEPALDYVQGLVDIPLGAHTTAVLRDVFTHYKIPPAERTKIIDGFIDTPGEATMYTLMAAVTQAANAEGLDPAHVESLMRMGGDLPHAESSRCNGCHRLMPH